MNFRGVPVIAIALLMSVARLSAQESIAVDQAALTQHIDHRVPPVYPPIAKAAHIQGAVEFDLKIDVSGKIESMKVVSGPAMLQQAAIDCLNQWTFHPFEKNGAPISATGRMSIIFVLSDYHPGPNDEKIAEMYFPLSDQCRKAVSARTDLAGAEAVCNQAGETAEQFGPDVRFIEKRSAFVFAATACANNRDLSKALDWANKAVEQVKLGHDDNSGSNAAYFTRGMVEGLMGDLLAADRDLTVAEDFERKGIAWAENVRFEHGDSYKFTMYRVLQFHAQVLKALNHPEEAQKKLDESTQYKTQTN